MKDKTLKRKVYEEFGLKCNFTGRTNKKLYDILENNKVVGYLNINHDKECPVIKCDVNLYEDNNSAEFNKDSSILSLTWLLMQD